MDNTLSEFDLISRLFAPLAQDYDGALALTDDAALVDVPAGHHLVTTTDSLVAGVHFLPHDPPETVAARILRTNLSDIAAMGAEPYVYTMALSLPPDSRLRWLESFTAHLARDQKRFGIRLIGGDTVRTPGPLSIAITALGLVPTDQALTRGRAMPGDRVYVSGTIGDAALGLRVLRGEVQLNDPVLAKYATDRFHFPSPRLNLGKQLRNRATACTDISDGLVRDLSNICRVSRCRAVIHWEDLPVSDACRTALSQLLIEPAVILTGGDDYELVFTAPKGVTVDGTIRIGEIESHNPGQHRVSVLKKGRIFEIGDDAGYEHIWRDTGTPDRV